MCFVGFYFLRKFFRPNYYFKFTKIKEKYISHRISKHISQRSSLYINTYKVPICWYVNIYINKSSIQYSQTVGKIQPNLTRTASNHRDLPLYITKSNSRTTGSMWKPLKQSNVEGLDSYPICQLHCPFKGRLASQKI